MANPNVGELLATTLQLIEGDSIVDQISNNNAILFHLKEMGSMKPCDGGPKIRQAIEYAENGASMWYSGAEELDISTTVVFDACDFNWKQYSVPVTITGLEDIQNSGKSQKFDLLESRIKNARRTFENDLAEGCYSDGTGSDSKEIGGLQLLLADTATSGTVGGISRTTYSWWRHYSYDCSSDGGAAASSSNILTYMNTVFLACSQRNDHPTMIVADNNYFSYFEQSQQAIQRIMKEDAKLAKAGFQTYEYKGIPVVYDGGLGGYCPSNHMYFLNGKYLYLRYHPRRNFTVVDGDRYAVNQDAHVRLSFWAGNMTISCPRKMAVMKA